MQDVKHNIKTKRIRLMASSGSKASERERERERETRARKWSSEENRGSRRHGGKERAGY